MNKTSRFFDTVLGFLVIFAIGFTVGARFTLRAFPSFLTGLVLALSISPLYAKLTRKDGGDDGKAKVKKALILMGEKNLLALVHSALKRKASTLTDNYIEIDDGKIFCAFTKASLSLDKLVSVCCSANCGKVLIIANAFDGDCFDAHTVCGAKVTLWDFEKFYAFLIKNDALPSVEPEKKRNKLKEFFNQVLRKENAKGYFKSAVVILALSAVVGVSIYYIVFAVISFALGVTVLFLPRKKT